MSIITKRGDDGQTDLLFSCRISKTSIRIEALGAVDEVNSALGIARAAGLTDEVELIVDRVQELLVGLMGQIACLPKDDLKYREQGYAEIGSKEVGWLEETSARFEGQGVKMTGWARPGLEHSIGRAGLDMARSIARRAERSIWQLHQAEGVADHVRLCINRLSDLLWILARADSSK